MFDDGRPMSGVLKGEERLVRSTKRWQGVCADALGRDAPGEAMDPCDWLVANDCLQAGNDLPSRSSEHV